MEGLNSYNDLDNNDWNNLVEGENGQYMLADFAEKKEESPKETVKEAEAEIISGESLKGEIIGGFEAKPVEQTTGAKDAGHPEAFERRQMKELSAKALVALISGEPKALDVPGFWMNEGDLAKNREAIDETRERLRGQSNEEFETSAKGLIEHLSTGVEADGIEKTYDVLKDKNEALVMIYRETWESLKDEPAWQKEAGEITEEEKAELGKLGIEAFMKKYPTAADFRKAQREFFGHIKGDSANQKMIQENLETYIQAMSELGATLYGEQELNMRALEGVRRQAKREMQAEATAVEREETEKEAEKVEAGGAVEVTEETEPEVKSDALKGDGAAEVTEEPEAPAKTELFKPAEKAPTEEELRREVERMADEAKAKSEALKAEAEKEAAKAKETKPEGELPVSEEADKRHNEQYQRFVRIANQRLLGFNRWRKAAEKAEKSKKKTEKKTEKKVEKKEAKAEPKKAEKDKTEKAEEAKKSENKIEKIATLADDREFIQKFEANIDRRYGTGYYLGGKKYEGMNLVEIVKQGLYNKFKVKGELFGKKQTLRISDPYEVEGRKAMTVYGLEKGGKESDEKVTIKTVIQNLKDGKFYVLDKYKMLKHEMADGKIDEGGVDWDATEEMLTSIKDENLQAALAEIAKGKMTVPLDALRAALGLAEKQISVS